MDKVRIGELAIATLGPRSLQDIAVGLITNDLGLINRTLRRAGLPQFEDIEEAKLFLPSAETLGYAASFKFKLELHKGW